MSSENEEKSSIGARWAEERDRLHVSRADIAKEAVTPMAQQSIGEFERGGSYPGGKALAAFARLGADVNYILTGRRTRDGGLFSLEEQAPPLQVNDNAVQYGPGLNIEVLRQIIEELERQLALEAEKEEPLTMTPYKKALAISMLYQRYISQDAGAEIAGIERGVRDLLTLLH